MRCKSVYFIRNSIHITPIMQSSVKCENVSKSTVPNLVELIRRNAVISVIDRKTIYTYGNRYKL